MSVAALLIARLKASVPDLKDVQGGANLAALKEFPPARFPCAYVYVTAEQGGANRYMTGLTAQRRTQTLGVVLVVRNVRDAIGAAAQSDLDALRVKVDAALMGYIPAPEYEPLVFSRGALLSLGDALLWWQDDYQTSRDVRG